MARGPPVADPWFNLSLHPAGKVTVSQLSIGAGPGTGQRSVNTSSYGPTCSRVEHRDNPLRLKLDDRCSACVTGT